MARVPKLLKAKAIRAILKMIEAVKNTPEMVSQNSFPSPDPVFTGDQLTGHVCSTPFCAADHLVLASKPKRFQELCDRQARGIDIDWESEAFEVLGISRDDVYAGPIFGGASDWPEKYYDQYAKAGELKTPKAQARGRMRAFIGRWEQFIKTGGADIIRRYYAYDPLGESGN